MITWSFLRGAVVFVAAAVLSSQVVATGPENLCDGFLPPNNVRIPVGVRHQWAIGDGLMGGLTEQDFNAVIDRFERLYRDEIAKVGGNLVVRRLWENNFVNAKAIQERGDWIIEMYGGLARHPAVTSDGLALVICHEAGHHLGGAPKRRFSSWPSTNEGGADYYATLKCLRRFFAEDDNATIVSAAQIDPTVKSQCERQFSKPTDQLICERISLASRSVGFLFANLEANPPPSFGTPDPSVVTEMYDRHPKAQCRLDTYFNGSVCPVELAAPLSDTDYHVGSCVQPQETVGFRPRCWFKP
jgi:hypothetical protein